MAMSVGEVLASWMRHRELSENELSRLSGVTQSTIHRIVTGQTRDPRRSIVEKLALTMGHSVDEVYYEAAGGNAEPASNYLVQHVFVDVPYYRNAELSAGNGAVVHDEDSSGSLSFRRDWLRGLGLREKNLAVVRCSGDSMEPRILNDDIVLINMSDKAIKDNQIYALNYGGEARIKRLVRRFDGSLIIRSDNPAPAYSDEIVPPELFDSLVIIGRAVWVGGLL